MRNPARIPVRRPPAGAAIRSGLWLIVLFMCGCVETPPPPQAAAGPVPPAPQRPGDSAAGRIALLNAPYITCGIPESAYRRTVDTGALPEKLPGRRDRNAELPYFQTAYTTSDGVDLVTTNCLVCHAARFNGELVIGLGNEFLDFTRDPVPAVQRSGLYVDAGAEAREWGKWVDRITAIAPYMITDTVGVNPAPNVTLALIAHRDPRTLAWSPDPLLEPPPRTPLPVSVPPWWRMAKKHAMFYTTVGRGDHARMMMMESLVCTDSVAEARSIDSYFTDVRAYLTSLRPPLYPYPVDPPQATRGRAVFETHCSGCHGTYGDDGVYPNLVVALEAVGTDPAYARQAVDHWGDYARWFQESFYGELARATPALGYIAPPLDGVWATAPYLHNGSVPSLEVLLDSARRPTYWRHADPAAPQYDDRALGWRFTVLPHGKSGVTDTDDRRTLYDTTLHGYGNGGHSFGDILSDADRRAVLEYLKTI